MYLCENIVIERRLFEIAILNVLLYYLDNPCRIECVLKYPLIIVFSMISRIITEYPGKTETKRKTSMKKRKTSGDEPQK